MATTSISNSNKVEEIFYFFSASINGKAIFVRCVEEAHPEIIEVFMEGEYKISSVSEHLWETNIELGNSYEVESIEEAREFINNNIKFRR